MKISHFWLAHLALFVVSLLYGANYSIAKEVVPHYLQPTSMIVVRITVATLFFWLIEWVRHPFRIELPQRRDLGYLLLCSTFGVVANQLLFFRGLSLTSPVNASVIMITTPMLVLLVSLLIRTERATPYRIVGVLLGALGAALMILEGGDLSLSSDKSLGNLLVLLNATSYGIYLVLVRSMMGKYSALFVTRWLFTLGVLPVIVVYFIEFGFRPGEISSDLMVFLQLPFNIWLAVLYVVLGVTVLVYFLNVWAVEHVGPTVVGFYIYLQPIMAAFFAFFFQELDLTPEKLLYTALVFAGGYLVGRKTGIAAPKKKVA
jgi:drug/metabolite transporter (DMT)-like permease